MMTATKMETAMKQGEEKGRLLSLERYKERDDLGEYFSPIEKMFRERKGAVYAVFHVSEPD